MILDICYSPALYSYYKNENDTTIIVDIFRATTTMCMALYNGARAIIPVADISEAEQYKAKGYLVGAERSTRKCDFADFGNSPFEYTKEIVNDKEVVFTTTNGTRAIYAARESANLLIGAFSNLQAIADRCIEIKGRIVVLCAGWENKVNIEDTLFGGVLAEILMRDHKVEFGSDAVQIALELWKSAKGDLNEFIKTSDHYKRLVANNAEGDASFCLTPNTMPIIPYLSKNEGNIILG